MLKRVSGYRGLLLFFLLLLFVVPVHAGEPTNQVKQTVDKILDILKAKEMKRPERAKERRTALRKVIGERFDFEEMAKRSLALYWAKRTPEERKEFVSLYSDLLERIYLDKIEEYTDEKILYAGESTDGEYAVVRTRILTKKNVEIPIDYRLLKKDGKWAVYDVTIEGVSLVSNYRTQFNSIIRSGGYDELIRRLEKKQVSEATGKQK